MTESPAMASPVVDTDEALLELRFIARADRLKLMRGGVFAAAQMCGFGDVAAQNIVLAIDEACQNIIVHGYGERTDGTVILSLFRHEGGILVRLRDFAPPLDSRTVKPRDLADIRPGKLGSHFIREIMDTVQYRPASEGRGTVLEMTKRHGEPR